MAFETAVLRPPSLLWDKRVIEANKNDNMRSKRGIEQYLRTFNEK